MLHSTSPFPGKIRRASPLATINTNVDMALEDDE